MAIETTFDESRELTAFTVEGPLVYADVEQAMKSFYEGSVSRNVLWDLRNASVEGFTAAEVKQLAASPDRFTEERRGGRTAIVASGDLAFGLSRMFQSFGESKDLPFPIRVFRAKEEALDWIDEGVL